MQSPSFHPISGCEFNYLGRKYHPSFTCTQVSLWVLDVSIGLPIAPAPGMATE